MLGCSRGTCTNRQGAYLARNSSTVMPKLDAVAASSRRSWPLLTTSPSSQYPQSLGADVISCLLMKGLSVLIPVGGAMDEDEWRSNAFAWVHARYKELLPDAELCLGTSDQQPYNRAQARNDAFSQATGDMLLIADADTVINISQITKAIQLIREVGAPWVIPYTTYFNLTEKATAYLLQTASPGDNIPEFAADDKDYFIHRIEDSPGGFQMLPRAGWEALGGWDERWQGWGADDNAWRCALDTLWGPHRRCPGAALHLWHPLGEGRDAADFSQPSWPQNASLLRKYQRAAGNPDAMRRLLQKGPA